VSSRFHAARASSAISRARCAGIGPWPSSSPGSSSSPARVLRATVTCTSGRSAPTGRTAGASACPARCATRRPVSSATRTSARRASMPRGSPPGSPSVSMPRASRVIHSCEAAASGAVIRAQSVAMPSSPGYTSTRRAARARRWRPSAPSGSRATTARRRARSSCPHVCSGARGSTRCCTAAAVASSSTAVRSAISRARDASSEPASRRSRVSRSGPASRTARATRSAADPGGTVRARAISSHAHGRACPDAGGPSSGRPANSASSACCRAAAQAAIRSKATIPSTSSASVRASGSSVARSRSSAAVPDGRASAQIADRARVSNTCSTLPP
jgi:hypothetical protein